MNKKVLLFCFLNLIIIITVLRDKTKLYGQTSIKDLEIKKAEIIRDYNLETYHQLKELYKDYPNHKALKKAKLDYQLSEIDLSISRLALPGL